MNHCLHCNKDTKNKFCNNHCQNDWRYTEYIKRWLDNKESGMKGKTSISVHIRRYLFLLHNDSCQLCGWKELNRYTGKVPLEIDHIDGNYKNNIKNNLQLLCSNCHSLTPNYRSRNKGKGRNRKYYI